MQPSDGMILVIGPRLEGHSVMFLAIQSTSPVAFSSPSIPSAYAGAGLRRRSSPVQAQDFPEHVPRHRHLSQLERNVAAMSDNLGSDLHQLVGNVVIDQCSTSFGKASDHGSCPDCRPGREARAERHCCGTCDMTAGPVDGVLASGLDVLLRRSHGDYRTPQPAW